MGGGEERMVNTYLCKPSSGFGGSWGVRPWGMEAKMEGAIGTIGRKKGKEKGEKEDVRENF